MSWSLHKSLKMNDYESELAEWGISQYDPYGIGLHARIRHINLIDEKKRQLQYAKADYEACKAEAERNWNAKTFQAYTDASWDLKLCKKELDALMHQ